MLEWLKDAIFYQVYPQSFYDSNNDGIGDINGITEKLDYIKDLGCNAIWVNPCYDSPFMDGGYDVRNYKQVAPRYGTNEDLENLFQAAHKKGIKILLDLVPGHTSDTNDWFLKSKEPTKNEYSNRYIWTSSVWDAPPQYRMECGITDRDGNYLVNYFSSQPALNYGFHKVTHPRWQLPCNHPDCLATVEALKDVMRFWLSKGCDGFRVDMADSLVKNDDEKIATAKIWRGVRQMLDEEYPNAALVAEWCHPVRAINNAGFHMDFYLDHVGNGYSTLFRYEKDGEDKSFFSPNGKGDVTIFTDEYVPNLKATKGNGYISFFTCNHDNARMSKTFDERTRKLAYSTIFTMPGVPFLYYGDEIGMAYRADITSKEGGFNRTGSRTPMQWSSGKNLGFSTAEEEDLYLPVEKGDNAPTVENQIAREGSIYHTVKDIIKLRKENSDLGADGDFEVLFAQKNKYPFVYKRGSFVIFVNPSNEKTNVKLDVDVDCKDIIYLIGGFNKDNGITLDEKTFLILKAK